MATEPHDQDMAAAEEFSIAPRFELSEVPHLCEYFGLWHVYAPPFNALVERYSGVNLHAHIQSADAKQAVERQSASGLQITPEGIALLNINGPMMKQASSMSGGTSTVRMRRQMRAAKNDPLVQGVLLTMDTPGGTAKGNRDLADELRSLAAAKPVFVYAEDLVASAGVSIASQATKRFANNATALYGAMGTYSVLVDQSGAAEKLGVKVHVIKAGDYKGMGEPGTEITDQQLAEAQRICNVLNDGYLGLIASGLGKPVSEIKAIADGRIHPAADALKMGLIDGIQNYDQTYQQLVSLVKSNPKSKGTAAMSQTNTQPEKQKATLGELKATFKNSTAEWREIQLEAGASLSEAAIAYASHVEEKAATAETKYKADLEAATAKNSAGGNKSLGHKPVAVGGAADDLQLDGEQSSGDAIADWNAAVAKVAGPKADLPRRQRAIRSVATARPELYQAYMVATNPGKRQRRLITEKLESTLSDN